MATTIPLKARTATIALDRGADAPSSGGPEWVWDMVGPPCGRSLSGTEQITQLFDLSKLSQIRRAFGMPLELIVRRFGCGGRRPGSPGAAQEAKRVLPFTGCRTSR
ncbi:hypothetical protein GCM10009654_43160 [Streptomyces hebeiensis]|uniref:Uncharacterized protein n=1 Tax=Streptomyces hebeiensis TaxID=229486 RepID=A0ABN1UYL9_9ACTN